MARSEVKNYLAELAEDAELAFISPEALLRGVRSYLVRTNERAEARADERAEAADWNNYEPGTHHVFPGEPGYERMDGSIPDARPGSCRPLAECARLCQNGCQADPANDPRGDN